jgi:nicotinate-nucleotide pyrophosphorylase (carboxylating)
MPASVEAIAAPLVRAALLEDFGRCGDITTEAIVAADGRAHARIVARQDGVIAGLDVATLAFAYVDGTALFEARVADGDRVVLGQTVAAIDANARAVLTAERTALNFLGLLSGVATATRAYVDAIAGTRARIVDTRKTTPGLRALQRYAVRCGGGWNHRFGLDDGVLIKDNHLAVAASIHDAVAAARARAGHMVKVEIEVDTIEQLQEALEEPIDAVILDNMSPALLREAVALIDGRVITEASGSVTLDNVVDVARTGVDLISIGRITHSAPSLDLSLEVDQR